MTQEDHGLFMNYLRDKYLADLQRDTHFARVAAAYMVDRPRPTLRGRLRRQWERLKDTYRYFKEEA